MKIMKKSDYSPDPGEKIAGRRITESAGYVPAKTKIEEMIAAGQRLVDYRAENYDFPPNSEVTEKEVDEFFDPTRSPGFDAVDAQNMTQDALNRVKARQESKKGENHGKEKDVDSEPSEEGSDKDKKDKAKNRNGEEED